MAVFLVEGLYEDVQEPNERSWPWLIPMPNAIQGNQSDLWFGIASLQEDRAAFLKRFFFEPALNIEGIPVWLSRPRS